MVLTCLYRTVFIRNVLVNGRNCPLQWRKSCSLKFSSWRYACVRHALFLDKPNILIVLVRTIHYVNQKQTNKPSTNRTRTRIQYTHTWRVFTEMVLKPQKFRADWWMLSLSRNSHDLVRQPRRNMILTNDLVSFFNNWQLLFVFVYTLIWPCSQGTQEMSKKWWLGHSSHERWLIPSHEVLPDACDHQMISRTVLKKHWELLEAQDQESAVFLFVCCRQIPDRYITLIGGLLYTGWRLGSWTSQLTAYLPRLQYVTVCPIPESQMATIVVIIHN